MGISLSILRATRCWRKAAAGTCWPATWGDFWLSPPCKAIPRKRFVTRSGNMGPLRMRLARLAQIGQWRIWRGCWGNDFPSFARNHLVFQPHEIPVGLFPDRFGVDGLVFPPRPSRYV